MRRLGYTKSLAGLARGVKSVNPWTASPRRDPELQCTAKSKQTRERRKRDVTPGERVWDYHDGASRGPKTAKGKARVALNNLRHGIFANRILDEEERETFDAIVARIQSDFSLNDSSDTIAAEALAMACLRRAARSALENCPPLC